MQTNNAKGLSSMIVGLVLMFFAAAFFLSVASSSVKEVNILMAFFLLYLVFAAGILLLAHGIFVRYPRSWAHVHHGISYSALLIALLGVAYCIYRALIQYL